MTLFLVSYNLREETGSERISGVLEENGGQRALDDVWLIEFDGDATELFALAKRDIGENDRLFVAELTVRPRFKKTIHGTKDIIDRNF